MKLLKNTLEVLMDRWDDPGDYPSNAGSGPLPSKDFLAGMEGEVQLELTADEIDSYRKCVDDFIGELDIKLPDGILSAEWTHTLQGNILTLEADDVEGDPDYCKDDGPDYDPHDDPRSEREDD